MKRFSVILLTFILLCMPKAYAQVDTLKYRVTLTDKLDSEYSIRKPQKFLSKKAIDRRKKQGLTIDETDLPVCASYVEKIKDKGVNIIVTGKWDNFVTIGCNDPLILEEIKLLPFVKDIKLVWQAPSDNNEAKGILKRDSLINTMERSDSYYGAGESQIKMSQVDQLHNAGYKGEGMTIAVVDAGFHNLDSIAGLDNVNVLGVKDFVNSNSDIYAENSHGLSVLSCIAMNKPHYMVGTAPNASFWLLRSEDDVTEHLIEQDFWSAAIEFADSVGVDVVNTSLGYNEFDDESQNLEYRQLDGKYSLMSRQASKMADKGMVLVCSAGNSGSGTWKKITSPGDADNILTVGAIGNDSILAKFSSIGNTADGRIKPDVMAVGYQADVMNANGTLGKANGTSFASPIMCGMVACFWQANPNLTAKEVIEQVQHSGDRVEYPDNIYGYGIPNLWEAYKKQNK